MFKKMTMALLVLLSIFTLVACQEEKEDIRLPNILNLTQEEASAALSNLKVFYVFEEVVNRNIPEGRVIGYGNDLEPQDIVEPFTTVIVYVAIHENILPNLTGKTQQEIIQAFQGMSVYLEFRETLTNNTPEGQFVNYGAGFTTGQVVPNDEEIIIFMAKAFIETERNLMISKYAEGSLFNRKIELYNPTNNAVDLSKYEVLLYEDGSETPTKVIPLFGMLQARGTYKISYSESSAEFKDNADLISSDLTFNGNDVVAIRFINGELVDVLGNIGWGLFIFSDRTLVRKENITQPSTTFNINDWDRYAKDYVAKFGTHPYTYPTTFTFNESDLLVSYYDAPGGMIKVDFVSNNDGDTAQFIPGFTGDFRVRFVGIDTPETGTGIVATQATQYVRNALNNATEIYLQYDPASGLTESYGRYLALVWYDGKLLNYELVRYGFSQNNYSDNLERLVFNGISLQTWMQNAENIAKAAGLGIWG